MSLLDINETEYELDELKYMMYDEFVKYLTAHCPDVLWDHSQNCKSHTYSASKATYYILESYRLSKQQNEPDRWVLTSVCRPHSHIWITPTDDGLVNLEFNHFNPYSFPIITMDKVPIGVMKVLEPLKDKLEIIKGTL